MSQQIVNVGLSQPVGSPQPISLSQPVGPSYVRESSQQSEVQGLPQDSAATQQLSQALSQELQSQQDALSQEATTKSQRVVLSQQVPFSQVIQSQEHSQIRCSQRSQGLVQSNICDKAIVESVSRTAAQTNGVVGNENLNQSIQTDDLSNGPSQDRTNPSIPSHRPSQDSDINAAPEYAEQ